MRKIILFMHMSLDGFVCGPNGELDWATINYDEIGKFLISDLLKNVDSMIIGRNLFQGFESYWPSVAKNSEASKDLRDFAQWIDEAPKYVFSKTLKIVGWQNSTIFSGDLAEEVQKLKQQPGKDIVVFGGAEFAAGLVRLGLVDEYRLKLEPVVLGTGKPLFQNIADRMRLKLTLTKSYDEV